MAHIQDPKLFSPHGFQFVLFLILLQNFSGKVWKSGGIRLNWHKIAAPKWFRSVAQLARVNLISIGRV